MDQSLYETVSEIESDVYYDSVVQSDRDRKTYIHSGKQNSDDQVYENISSEADLSKLDTTVVNKDVSFTNKETKDNKPDTTVFGRDDSFTSEETNNKNVLSESLTSIQYNQDKHIIAENSGNNNNKFMVDKEPEIENWQWQSFDSNSRLEVLKELSGVPPDVTESVSTLSSSKFSRFNRRRRNSSDSDESKYSDVSSMSASLHISQSRSVTGQLEADQKNDMTHGNSKSDVSSRPLSGDSPNVGEEDLSDSVSSESDSDSDSESSSSTSSDQTTSSSSSSGRSLLGEQDGEMSSEAKTMLPCKGKSELDQSRTSPQKHKTVSSPESYVRETTEDKEILVQKHLSYSHKYSAESDDDFSKKKESLGSGKSCSQHKSEREEINEIRHETQDIQNPNGRHYGGISGKIGKSDEKSKNSESEHREKGYLKHMINKKCIDTKRKEETFKNSEMNENRLKQTKVNEIEQIVLDARKQNLEKDSSVVTMRNSSVKVKQVCKVEGHTSCSQTNELCHISDARSQTINSTTKDRSSVKKHHLNTTGHEKLSRYKRSRSRTPPKAYSKDINKKVMSYKRIGSITPPKAYSKDLKMVQKRRSSGQHTGNAKKKRKKSSSKAEFQSDSDKSVSSLSDVDSESETENWRDKKIGVSRKRDDIERERRIRQAAAKEKLKKENKDKIIGSKDREYKEKREAKQPDRRDRNVAYSKNDIDSFDARDYRQHMISENRRTYHRSFVQRKPNERVFYRKNKTFIEEEPEYNKPCFFEEELSDESRDIGNEGVVSVIKHNRKRTNSDVKLDDMKISSGTGIQKDLDLSKQVIKERLIISVQDSSDENDIKKTKIKKTDNKKKVKHKRSQQDISGESEHGRKKQVINVTFSQGKNILLNSIYPVYKMCGADYACI